MSYLKFDSKYKYGYPDELLYDLKDLPHEEWGDIKDFEGKYQISNYGRVKSLKRMRCNHKERILKFGKNPKGYLCIRLSRGRYYKKTCRIHRTVIEYFIPNNENKSQAHHIDGQKLNNFFTNLQWVNSSEHSKLDYALGLDHKWSDEQKAKLSKYKNDYYKNLTQEQKRQPYNHKMKEYYLLSPDKKIYRIVGLHGFAKEFNLDRAAINRVVKKDNYHHKGWVYIDKHCISKVDVTKDYRYQYDRR